jgi:hypothetical protein
MDQQQSLGPAAGRWNEFMTGKVGAPNPDFNKIRVDSGLLHTLLMRMHTGRGGEYIQKHFEELLSTAKQSPENTIAALDEIDAYANDVKNEKPPDLVGGSAAPTGAAATSGEPASGTVPTFSEWNQARKSGKKP